MWSQWGWNVLFLFVASYALLLSRVKYQISVSNYWWQRSDIWSQASYGVPIWRLWPNIRSLSSIAAEKNVTKNVHICSMWQASDIWSQASYIYIYAILWEAFLDPSDSYFLFADLVGFYAHWTYMHIFRHNFLSNYWWQKSERTEVKQYTPQPLRGAGV
jgi:hypothetical protein